MQTSFGCEESTWKFVDCKERAILVEILPKNTARWRLEFENNKIQIKTRNSQKITQFTHTKNTKFT